MKMKLLYPVLCWLLVSACGKSRGPLVVPQTYDGTQFANNTLSQQFLRLQYDAICSEAQKGRTVGQKVLYGDLSGLFNIGNPSLKMVCTPYFATQLDTTNGWMFDLAQSSGNNYIPGLSSTKGGYYYGYLFNAKGLEMEQFIEKGLLSAVFYNQAAQMLQDGATREEVDQVLALFGSSPTFPNTSNSATAATPDRLMAKFATHRDKNDGSGMYDRIKGAFIRLQAAVEAGDDYLPDQELAIKDILSLWEKICFATVVHNCQNFVGIMSQSGIQETQRAEALHNYGEAVGFIYGWRTIPKSLRIASDSEIDVFLSRLRVAPGAPVQSYLFILDPNNAFPNIYQLEQGIQLRYQFTQAEMEEFKHNWVLEQGR
jgi:hypothetical protein